MNLENQQTQVELNSSINDINISITMNFCFEAKNINDIFLEAQFEEDKPARNITQDECEKLNEALTCYIEEQLIDMYDRDLCGDGYVNNFIHEHLMGFIK